MTIKIGVPDIRAGEVEIVEIPVKVGDKAEAEQSLITVEGDKASMEAPSPQAGIVKEIKVLIGDKTWIGALIMIFDPADGAADAAPAQAGEEKEAAPAAAPTAAATEDANVPGISNDEVRATETLAKAGDEVETEQSLITIEDGKASMEVSAPLADIAKEIRVNVGDKASTGLPIMVFKIAGKAGAAAPAARQEVALAAAPVSAAGMKEVSVSDIGGDETEVTGVIVRVGDKVAAEQSLITVGNDKASTEVPAPFAGVAKKLKVSVGDRMKTGSSIMIFEIEGAAPAAASVEREAAAPVLAVRVEAPAAAPAVKTGGRSGFIENDAYIHMTPLIHRLAREPGVNFVKVKGIGHKGRILCEDIQTYVKEVARRAEIALATTGGGIPGTLPWPEVDFSKFGEVEEVELGRIQKVSGANLNRNWVMIPHVIYFDKTDIIGLEASCKQQNEEAARCKLDMKITPVVFIMKAVAVTLEQMPRFNSSLPGDSRRLILKKYINIGVAVDTPNGLAVPIFKDVNKKGITKLSCELIAISKKARNGKLIAGKMQGGCFTISNIDSLGTTHSVPIVNALEVVILGVSKSAVEPVWSGKESIPRLMLPIPPSLGHRVIDGANGARSITITNNILSDIRRPMM